MLLPMGNAECRRKSHSLHFSERFKGVDRQWMKDSRRSTVVNLLWGAPVVRAAAHDELTMARREAGRKSLVW